MLDDVCHIGQRAIDSRFGKTAIEQFPRRPDKRMSGKVFGIAGLLANQHDPRPFGTFAEHSLGGGPVQMAIRAARGGFSQRRNAGLNGNGAASARHPRGRLHLSRPAKEHITEQT